MEISPKKDIFMNRLSLIKIIIVDHIRDESLNLLYEIRKK
jgi:hypothetical protein